jgi:hypothetical protein
MTGLYIYLYDRFETFRDRPIRGLYTLLRTMPKSNTRSYCLRSISATKAKEKLSDLTRLRAFF